MVHITIDIPKTTSTRNSTTPLIEDQNKKTQKYYLPTTKTVYKKDVTNYTYTEK